MTSIRVEPEHVSDLARAIAAAQAALSAQLSELQSAADLLAQLWSGDAQQAFLARYGAWSARIEELSDALRRCSDVADDAAETYEAADRRVGALWGM